MTTKLHAQRLVHRIPFGMLACAVLAFASTGCSTFQGPDVAAGTYYTTCTVMLEKGTFRSTNYRSDRTAMVLPANTEVEYIESSRRGFHMRIAGGREFTFEHVPKHTQDSAEDSFATFFSPTPCDLSAFSEEECQSIAQGKATVGMSKDCVLVAIGPPPATGTVNLDAPQWKYWNTRFTTFHVRFDDEGRVTEIGR